MDRPAEAVIDRYRRWLAKLGILDRPWLVFGSAPDPTVPVRLLEDHARIDINNSGRTAQMMGLGRADLTMRAKAKVWTEHPEIDTRGLLWVYTRPRWVVRLKLLRRPYRYIGSLEVLPHELREDIVVVESGLPVHQIGDLGKVTNGVAAACFGLACGVPSIVFAGISLDTDGHSYNAVQRKRLQIEEDREVLTALAARRDVFTTEASLACATNMRLLT